LKEFAMLDDEWGQLRDQSEYRLCLLRVDTVGSTPTARASRTDAVRATFSELAAHVETRVTAQGGRKWNWASDGGLFAFYSTSITQMAESAVTAAINIIENLVAFNRTQNQIGLPIQLRAAVHSGHIRYLSDTGSITSDEINFVCKLESATTPDSISISDGVYKELRGELRNRFRACSTFLEHKIWAPGIKRTGEAYILFEVEPGASDAVAMQVVKLGQPAVSYAAAVWGPWDVIARVSMNRIEDLLKFIDKLRNEITKIRRTETWCLRDDQPHFEIDTKADQIAFVLLRIDPQISSPETVLSELCRSTEQGGIQVRHVAGVLGPYDIAATVHYDDDLALRTLVMDNFQGRRAVRDTLTIPGIKGMVHAQIK
jgi:class 3 adenylate cyclase